MTVLFYKNNEISPNIGGISRISCNLRDSLTTRGYACFFLSATRNEHINPDTCQQWLPNLNKEYCELNVSWLHDFILNNNIDVIINNWFNSETVKLLNEARQGTNCKLITWIHNNVVEYGSLVGYRNELKLKKKHLAFIFKLLTRPSVIRVLRHLSKRKHQPTARVCYNFSDRIVTVSDGNVEEFLFLLGFNDTDNKLLAIPNFVKSLEKEVAETEKEKSVVWCGSVDFELKKTNWMLDIWHSIQSKFPDWTLTIMGDSSQMDAMKSYAAQLGAERIIFTGRVNPDFYYRRAAIICSTSITESFGLTMVEGMQRKVVPIAFSSSKALRDIVGYNGILIKPFDKRQFAAELSVLMKNEHERGVLSIKCRESAWLYDEKNIINRWENLFQTLTK